jgi:hypothetical protein
MISVQKQYVYLKHCCGNEGKASKAKDGSFLSDLILLAIPTCQYLETAYPPGARMG